MSEEIKKITSESALSEKASLHNKLAELGYYDDHPDALYKKISQVIEKIKNWEECSQDEQIIASKILYLDSCNKSHYFLAETLDQGLDIWAVEMTNNLIAEYNCNTTLEKSLCETIALNYGKMMQLSRNYTQAMNTGNKLTKETSLYLNTLNRELDRSNRAYLMSLNNLIDIKRPKMNINVKSKNAFIADNQQFNTNYNESENIRD